MSEITSKTVRTELDERQTHVILLLQTALWKALGKKTNTPVLCTRAEVTEYMDLVEANGAIPAIISTVLESESGEEAVEISVSLEHLNTPHIVSVSSIRAADDDSTGG